MLHNPTLEKLEAMRLHGMAQALREQTKDERSRELSFEERFCATGGSAGDLAAK